MRNFETVSVGIRVCVCGGSHVCVCAFVHPYMHAYVCAGNLYA